MSTALAHDLDYEIYEVPAQTKYKIADDEKLMEISRRLIEKHRKAYEALANA